MFGLLDLMENFKVLGDLHQCLVTRLILDYGLHDLRD